ncbi:DUF6266 family protein [Pedobacter gandavensis]|uniref:DUF6266 family protein n=1 Tax=Pedobacter gandavensis TaxID=2679963 RepID=UPI002931051C|nr:DUF6266 family protein [Pedobacter gandavensis]
MAKCTIGPYGHPSGKIGNVVFYMLNGQPVCRLIGRPGKPSLKQKGNRQAMSVTMDLVSSLTDFINVSFKLEAEGTVRNPHNLATSYNKKQALTGEYPNIKVDYTKVILSNGDLEMAEDLRIRKGTAGINIRWNSSALRNGAADDILMVAVSHPTKKRATSFLNAARRSDGGCFIPLNEEWMLQAQMEVYVCFKSANEKMISDSAYAGNLNGQPETAGDIAAKTKYNALKARFDLVEADYLKKRTEIEDGVLGAKAFRTLATEYHALKMKLENLPGKPS